jgi:putative SOS response-associated peptidase YedK
MEHNNKVDRLGHHLSFDMIALCVGRWSATMQKPENAASTCCGGVWVPYRAKDLKVGFANINAKAEGIGNRPAFREAFQRRRCLLPVDNFYEWKKASTGKQPYAIALADRGLMALAGVRENWRSPEANGCGASRSSPRPQTSCAPSCTTECR